MTPLNGEKIKSEINIDMNRIFKRVGFYLCIFFISRINFYEIFSIFGLSLYIAGVKNKINNVIFKKL